jgi:hypothetical protein
MSSVTPANSDLSGARRVSAFGVSRIVPRPRFISKHVSATLQGRRSCGLGQAQPVCRAADMGFVQERVEDDKEIEVKGP